MASNLSSTEVPADCCCARNFRYLRTRAAGEGINYVQYGFPHPALRATFSQREKESPSPLFRRRSPGQMQGHQRQLPIDCAEPMRLAFLHQDEIAFGHFPCSAPFDRRTILVVAIACGVDQFAARNQGSTPIDHIE